MSSSVLVDTSEVEGTSNDAAPVVVGDGNNMVTIDTLQSDLDQLVKEAPVVRRPTPKRPSPPILAEKRVSQRPPAPPVQKKMPDGQAAFQEALKKTVVAPSMPASDVQEQSAIPPDDITFPDVPAKRGRQEEVVEEGTDIEQSSSPGDEEEEDGEDASCSPLPQRLRHGRCQYGERRLGGCGDSACDSQWLRGEGG